MRPERRDLRRCGMQAQVLARCQESRTSAPFKGARVTRALQWTLDVKLDETTFDRPPAACIYSHRPLGLGWDDSEWGMPDDIGHPGSDG